VGNSCFILLQTGGRIKKQDNTGFILLTNCVVIPEEDNVLGNKKDYHQGHYIKHDHNAVYRKVIEEYQKEQLSLAEAESRVIDMQKRAQEMRLEQIRLQQLQNQEAELAELANAMQLFMSMIEEEKRKIIILRNNLAFLVLMMADPFLMVGGVRILH
jgi:hypothetical protein